MRTIVLGAATLPGARGTVLTLNRRAAARLGVPTQRLDAFARQLVLGAGQAVAPATLAQRLLTGAVRDALDVPDPSLVARSLGGPLRELLRGGADLEGLSADPSPQVRRLALVAKAYRAALRDYGVIDAVETVRQAAALAAPQLLTVFGYVRLSADELLLIDAAAGDGSALALPWEDHPYFEDNLAAARSLEARGWTVTRASEPAAGLAGAFLGRPGGAGTLYAAASEDDEVRAALRRVKGLLRVGTDPADIALVVADDDHWAPLVRAVAWEYGVPVRFSTSVPLGDTRPGRWPERVLVATEEGLGFDALARVLAHPLDAGMDGPAWQRARARRPQDVDDWRALGLDAGGFEWPDLDTRAGWTARLEALLTARGIETRARQTQDLLALNFLRAELAVLAAPAHETLTRTAFVQELREALQLLTVPSDPSSSGVELLTLPSLVGAEVSHVIVLGAVDGGLPARLQDDSALDFIERRRLARQGVSVETAASLARRDAVTFWALLEAVGKNCSLNLR